MRLAQAVVQQAVHDMGLKRDTSDFADAKQFLTSDAKEWRRSREFWTSIAGIDEEAVTDYALDVMSGVKGTEP